MLVTTRLSEEIYSGTLILATVTVGMLGFLTPEMVAAAFSGSVTAILYKIMFTKAADDEPPTTPLKATSKLIVMFAIASVFGIFMGSSISSFSPLDQIAATYMGGLLGFGLISGLLSPESVKKMTEWIINAIAGRGKQQ